MREKDFAFLVSLIVAAPAMATPYGSATMTYVDMGNPEVVSITDTRTGMGVNNLQAYTGISQIRVANYVNDAGTPSVPGGGGQFDGRTIGSFCIDIADSVDFGDVYNVTVTPLNESPDPDAAPVGGMGAVKASQVAWLLDYTNPSLDMDSLTAAGLQLAIWEVVNEYDASYSVYSGDGGNFYSSSNSDVQSKAQTLLGGLLGAGGWTAGYSFAGYLGLSSDLKQDFVVKAVPLPGAVMLGFLGLGVAGMRLRRLVG